MERVKKIIKVIFLTILSILILACGKDTENNLKEIKTTMSMDIDSLNPYKMVSSGTEEIMLNVFEGLLMPNSKGELTPAIAESYKISEDGRIYTFKIRKGIKFHNGNPLDVKDVEFSLNRMAGKDGFPPASALFNEIEEIKVVSEDEIEKAITIINNWETKKDTLEILPAELKDKKLNPAEIVFSGSKGIKYSSLHIKTEKKNKIAIRENKRDKIFLWNRIYSGICTFSLSC